MPQAFFCYLPTSLHPILTSLQPIRLCIVCIVLGGWIGHLVHHHLLFHTSVQQASIALSSPTQCIAQVTSIPGPKRSKRFRAELLSCGKWTPATSCSLIFSTRRIQSPSLYTHFQFSPNPHQIIEPSWIGQIHPHALYAKRTIATITLKGKNWGPTNAPPPPTSLLPFCAHAFSMLRAKASQFFLQHTKHLDTQPGYGIFLALIFGETSYIQPIVWTLFKHTNTLHLIAVSGMHFQQATLLPITFFSKILSMTHPLHPRRLAMIFTLPWVMAFTLLTGSSVSAIRACLMMILGTLRVVLHRPSNPFQDLCLSALLQTTLDPFCFYQIGFQLSYAMVASLLLFAHTLPHGSWLSKQLGTSFISQVWSYYYFGNLTPWGIFANLLAIPLFTYCLMPMAFILLWLSLLQSKWVVPLLEWLLSYLLNPLVRSSHACLFTV